MITYGRIYKMKKIKNFFVSQFERGTGFGILISDHNVRDTMQICHKVLIMSEGKIVAEGIPQEVSKNKKVKEVYLGKDFLA